MLKDPSPLTKPATHIGCDIFVVFTKGLKVGFISGNMLYANYIKLY